MYLDIKSSVAIPSNVIDAQRQVYSAVNAAMVTAYWNIGKAIYEVCGESDRAAYGKQILKYISDRLTAEFGKGYTVRNLRNMRQFYLAFSKRHTVCAELSWSHYRLLMRVEDEKASYIDLVFYNYILKCFVLIDLKTEDLTHQDVGQMQMYVNYYTREMMNEGDNPPIGILLCADKSDTFVLLYSDKSVILC